MTIEYGHRTLKPGDVGAVVQRAALDRQRRRLRSWEDPTNGSPSAVVYREMCKAADLAAMNGGRAPSCATAVQAFLHPSARAAAASPSVAAPPSAADGDTGGAWEPLGSGKSPVAPGPSMPCAEVDPLSGAVCNRKAGHGSAHKAVDEDFEFLWTSTDGVDG